jgi:hypothetical protein
MPRISVGPIILTGASPWASIRAHRRHFAISTTFARSSSVISVSVLNSREISQIVRAATAEPITTIKKATMIHKEGRTACSAQVLTGERG